MPSEAFYTITVIDGQSQHVVKCAEGAVLRTVLLNNNISPYGRLSDAVNCRGLGLCATCGVRVHIGPEPTHWHDKLAQSYGYPRLSCQIMVNTDMTIELIQDKVMWGQLWPSLSNDDA